MSLCRAVTIKLISHSTISRVRHVAVTDCRKLKMYDAWTSSKDILFTPCLVKTSQLFRKLRQGKTQTVW